MYRGATDDMTGVGIQNLHVLIDRKPLVVFDGDKMVQGVLRVLLNVQRQYRGQTIGPSSFVGVFYIVLLDASRIFQKSARQFLRGVGAEDLAGKTVLKEFWYETRMIDVCVRKDEVCHFGGGKAPIAVEHIRLSAHTLEHPTVEEVFFAVCECQEMFGPCDDAGGAMESNFHDVDLDGFIF